MKAGNSFADDGEAKSGAVVVEDSGAARSVEFFENPADLVLFDSHALVRYRNADKTTVM